VKERETEISTCKNLVPVALNVDDSRRWNHVRVYKTGENGPLVVYDLTESSLKRGITAPYSQGKRFLFGDKIVNASEITGIRIYATENRWNQLPLTNFEQLTRSTYGTDVTMISLLRPQEKLSQSEVQRMKL
jgi:hypothetical protein